MIKIRIEGLPKDAERMAEVLKNFCHVLSVSEAYPNRGVSQYVRIYADTELRQGGGENGKS